MAADGNAPALPIGEALHPVTVAAVVLLVVNDWVLKPRFGNAVTGKLSDVAGLVAAPLLLSAVIGLLVRRGITQRRLVACIAATGLVFTMVKLVPRAAALYASAVSVFGRQAHVVVDPTDLLCLPMLAVAYAIGRRFVSPSARLRRPASDR